MGKKTIAILSIFATIGAVYISYYLNTEAPDVRYSLSQRIPLSFTLGQLTESVQQLTVRNVGNEKAENIQVLIDDELTSYALQRHSKADSVQLFEGDSFEMVYPSLPPMASFSVTLRTANEGITSEQIKIRHDKGLAKDALALDTKDSTYLIVWGIIIFYWIGFSVWMFKSDNLRQASESKYRYEEILAQEKPFYISNKRWKKLHNQATESGITYWRDRTYFDCDKILEMPKPIYFNEQEWEEIRQKALDEKLDRGKYSINVEENIAYKLLSQERPPNLSDHGWEKIIKKAKSIVSDKILASSIDVSIPDSLLGLLKIERPQHVPVSSWNEIREKVSQRYVFAVKERSYFYPLIEGLIKALKEEKPSQLDEKYWEEIQDHYRKKYFKEVSLEIEHAEDPIEFLEEIDIDLLNSRDREAISKRAYNLKTKKVSLPLSFEGAQALLERGRPDWMDKLVYMHIKYIAESVVELEENKRWYQEAKSLIESILHDERLPEIKPDPIPDEVWATILKIKQDIGEREKGIRDKLQTLEEQKEEVIPLMQKVTQQLEIIDSVLNGKIDVLSKIEAYNNPFASGNFQNLKNLAKLVDNEKSNPMDEASAS